MILKIEITKKNVVEIQKIFKDAYKVEATIINAINFPPLQRRKSQFIVSNSTFYAYHSNDKITGLIEIKKNKNSIHIQSLVVSPKKFREGIGKKLMTFVLEKYNLNVFTVETGAENYPAINLYLKLGFKEESQFNTDHGIRKVKFKKFL